MAPDQAAEVFREFVEIIKALRTPGTGCPWDLEQNHDTLKPYLIEETYEVVETIEGKNDRAFQEELGDLLLQIVLHAQVADDRQAFSITEVIRGIAEKMVRRHPHVFGSAQVNGSGEVLHNWEKIKTAEIQEKGGQTTPGHNLARLPKGLPALLRAQRLGERAAQAGLVEGSISEVLNTVRKNFEILEKDVQPITSVVSGTTPGNLGKIPEELRAQLENELGDVLFNLCQLSRWLGLNAENCLRARNQSFIDNFQIEQSKSPPISS